MRVEERDCQNYVCAEGVGHKPRHIGSWCIGSRCMAWTWDYRYVDTIYQTFPHPSGYSIQLSTGGCGRVK
jgi:hypothetical protein